jgi:hypothetical protein
VVHERTKCCRDGSLELGAAVGVASFTVGPIDVDRTDFEQLQPQVLKLGEHAVECCLIRYVPRKHRHARFGVHLQAGEGTNQHLAQVSADADLVTRRLRRVLHSDSLS